jgi:hypothetical protein
VPTTLSRPLTWRVAWGKGWPRHANNPVEADHGRLEARLRPMRGLKRHRSARIHAAGHAFVQNLRRGHYEIAAETPRRHRLLSRRGTATLSRVPREGTTQRCRQIYHAMRDGVSLP